VLLFWPTWRGNGALLFEVVKIVATGFLTPGSSGTAATLGHPRCLIPRCGGTIDHHAARDALWAKFSTAAPARRRRSVAQYNYVKRV